MTPFFIDGPNGALFCIHHPASGGHGPAVLFLPSFAEENNRSRHMVARQARALAAAGIDVLLLDPTGVGDSAGTVADADWQTWHGDVLAGRDWLRAQGHDRVVLWGLRLGGLLAADVLAQKPAGFAGLLLWQPVVSGGPFVKQFLRLKLTGDMAHPDSGGETTQSLKARLAEGETLEIAGYAISPGLAATLEGRRLADLAPSGMPAVWLDVTAGEALTPASDRTVTAWRDAGVSVAAEAVAGPPFWTLQEPEWSDPLIDRTTALAREAWP